MVGVLALARGESPSRLSNAADLIMLWLFLPTLGLLNRNVSDAGIPDIVDGNQVLFIYNVSSDTYRSVDLCQASDQLKPQVWTARR